MGFSEQLKKARLIQNLSEKELAELIGVNLKTYKGYEDGKTIPRIKIIKELAIALNITSDELLEM